MKEEIFAKGYNAYKLLWVFVLMSIIGAFVEMIFMFMTTGIIMSRSSLLYGQLSIVWGLGGTLLTMLLHDIPDKRHFVVFIIGVVAGGTYEYICSLVTETFFGVKFWDYSDFIFNIEGRVNLLFCVFWGFIALIWVQWIYPKLEKMIESIPMKIGRVLTIIIVVVLSFDIVLSASALIRSYERGKNISPSNDYERFLDQHYDDQYLQKRYENMKSIIKE